MRLPQSSLQYLPIRAIALVMAGLVSLTGLATARAQGQQLVCTPGAVRFGTIVVGQSENVPMTLTNIGSTDVTILKVNSPVAAFSVSLSGLPMTVPAGQSVNFDATFTPQATGWVEGAISLVSTAFNKTVFIGMVGLGVVSESLTAYPSTLAFGNVQPGASSTLPITLTNSGTTEIRLAQTQTSGTGFKLNGPALPLWLAPRKSVTFNMTFAPQSTGTVSGSLYVPNGGATVPLTGTGGSSTKGLLTLIPTPLNFGSVTVGTTGTQMMTVSATGASVTISSGASSNSQFVLGGASFPLTVPAGQSASFNVAFSPKSGGTVSGTLSFASDAANSPAMESVAGSGTLPQYSVNLSWSSNDPQIAGYNVYRATGSGSYAKINSTLNPSTAYTDSAVVSGHTYSYAATAVNSSGQESTYSAPTTAVIP
jgi:hypothetical protein